METILPIVLFIAMIAGPCFVALMASRGVDREEEVEETQFRPAPRLAPVVARAVTRSPASLRQVAAEAEVNATMARQRATLAHREALIAAARAATLQASVAAEFAAEAEHAARHTQRLVESEISRHYLRENHSSLNFPRTKTSPNRAA